MKKIILFVATIFTLSSVFAQDLVNKKGQPILPLAGDYSVSIDATSFLNYAGNFIGGNGLNVAPTVGFLNGAVNQVITGKFFVTDQIAYRAGIRLGFSSTKNALVAGTADDYKIDGQTTIGLTGGIEYRLGTSRLQAYYGAEAGIVIGGNSSNWDYENNLSSTYTFSNASRSVKTTSGTGFGIGARGFGGIEYFVLPKISIGGEIGWGLALQTRGLGKTTTEKWNGSAVATTETVTGTKYARFSADSDNLNSIFGPAGTLRISFYF